MQTILAPFALTSRKMFVIFVGRTCHASAHGMVMGEPLLAWSKLSFQPNQKKASTPRLFIAVRAVVNAGQNMPRCFNGAFDELDRIFSSAEHACWIYMSHLRGAVSVPPSSTLFDQDTALRWSSQSSSPSYHIFFQQLGASTMTPQSNVSMAFVQTSPSSLLLGATQRIIGAIYAPTT